MIGVTLARLPGWLLFSIALAATTTARGGDAPEPPNIVYILADDLGYAELGCYGQSIIETPNLDRLAAEGLRFTQHYAGSPVCAPSRCALLTGRHTGRAYIRGNHEMGGWERGSREGQLPLPAGTRTLAGLLRDRGYATAAIGKWGLGGPQSTGHPNRQGFDHWFGYLCQRLAHNYYPEHLWRNETMVALENPYFRAHQRLETSPPAPGDPHWDAYRGRAYAPDLLIEEAVDFVRRHAGEPFFLYYATPVPHAAIQVPEASLRRYADRLDEGPYTGDKGYLPHPQPRAGYAAMVTRLDRDIGRLLATIDALGLRERTLVMFSSDNGPTFNGGTDSSFFGSAGPLRGLKTMLYEGGIRVPLIARWPGVVEPGRVSHHVCAFWDVLPTIAELIGAPAPPEIDGLSFAPTLLGPAAGAQASHEALYWEHRGDQAVRLGRWKGVRRRGARSIELYDLELDVGETTDVAAGHPEVVGRIDALMRSSREPSTHFPLER